MKEESIKAVYLKTPDLSDEHIIGYNAGVRPFRKSGVRIEREIFKDKLLIHNYGYGGSGLTLCWGGSAFVKKQLNSDTRSVAIIGAGVIGLACAYDLLQAGITVTIYADKFFPHLTSNVAAGIISYPVVFGKETEEQKQLLAELFEVSTKRYLDYLQQPEFAGTRVLNDYIFEEKVQYPHLFLNEYKSCALEETKVVVHFDNGLTKPAVCKRVFGLDGKLFLADLEKKVKVHGATFVKKHFKNKNELTQLAEETIINCSGLGAQQLVADDEFIPIRGQLVYFKPQLGIDYATYESVSDPDFWVKIYPWADRLILNGVYEHDQQKPEVNLEVVKKLLTFARESFKR